MNKKRLTKSSSNSVVFGVLGGIAEYLGIDATLLRILFLVIGWSGGPVFIYFLLALIIPEDPKGKPWKWENYDGGYRYTGDSINREPQRERKEARKVTDDEWSDF